MKANTVFGTGVKWAARTEGMDRDDIAAGSSADKSADKQRTPNNDVEFKLKREID